jgi:amino acid adenylation domain-containing protein/FkbH-like protein
MLRQRRYALALFMRRGSEVMNHETVGELDSNDGSLDREAPSTSSNDVLDASGAGALQIAIAATFTVEPLQSALEFWMRKLELAARIEIAPYAQVLQELYDPRSLLARNQNGCNIIVLRLEDWARERQQETASSRLHHIRATALEFEAALQGLRSRTSAAILLYFCPPSQALDAVARTEIAQIQADVVRDVSRLHGVHCWMHEDLQRLYPLQQYEDERTDHIAHIPYTQEYFVALGTLLARGIAALSKPRFKVIALDCDNTLWRGICGEDGASGIELTAAHLEFQRLLVRQHEAGMLLCLCSKNNEADVEAVFTSRPEMPLRLEHVVTSRVNWSAKSANLRSLAEELQLGLESFILMDDSALECAEVRGQCPGVLTVQMPLESAQIQQLLQHLWAFDHLTATEEAKRRTQQYRENRARSKAREEAGDLQQFLTSLKLQVDVAPMQAAHLPRVAELIQRTNQFNLSGVRLRAGELEALWKNGELQAVVVHVRDRFGDYGLVGAVLYRCMAARMRVDTFVLSCRALGRGAEHRIVNELGRLAQASGATHIDLTFRQTPRNAPARQFLEMSFPDFRSAAEGAAQEVVTVSSEHAQTLGQALPLEESSESAQQPAGGRDLPAAWSHRWHEEASRLSRLEDIVAEVECAAPKARRAGRPYVAPRSLTEAALAEIWGEVLGLEQVGIRDDFFESGGDSLRAVRAISRIGATLGLELSIYDFYEGRTVEQVATCLVSAVESVPPLRHVDRSQRLPLSWSQQLLWFTDRLEGGSVAYHIPLAIRLHGDLDCRALQAALDALLSRHEALRTVFMEADGEPVQRIVTDGTFALQTVDLCALEIEVRAAAVHEQLQDEVAAPFDLSSGPLVRGRLLRLSCDEHVLSITMHHIVSDGWSIGVLIGELAVLYAACRESRPDPLAPLPIQYVDYAYWQRQWLNDSQLQGHLAYWREHLDGAPELLELPTDRPRPRSQSHRGGVVDMSFGAPLTSALKRFSRRHHLTLAMTLYAAWLIVLARLSGQDDLVVGMPVANRRRVELETLIGFFVNMLAVRIRLERDAPIADLLNRVKEAMLGAYAHQEVPFERVVQALRPTRSLSHSPIFQVMFVLQNAPRGTMQLPGLTLTEEEVPLATSQFDLAISLREATDRIIGTLHYSSDLFDKRTIERWAGYLMQVLNAMVRDPQIATSRIALLGDPERQQILQSFNETHAAYPCDRLIHELIEAQVERTPNATAILYQGKSVSYAELNARANQLARHLLQHAVGRDQLVGICVERGLEMVVGLLGILKAGAAYLPIDPAYPAARLRYLLDDAAPRIVLTQAGLASVLPQGSAGLVLLDRDWPLIAANDASNVNAEISGARPHSLAYVIYTSGSTGQPKGVTITHANVVNHNLFACSEFGLAARDRVLQFATVCFDASVEEIFPILMVGGTLVLQMRTTPSAAELSEQVLRDGVTVLDLPTAYWQAWLDTIDGDYLDRCPLRLLIVGGERVTTDAVRRWGEIARPDQVWMNTYGPTEATVTCTYHRVDRPSQLDPAAAVPIGRPIPNAQIYVLDGWGEPVPIAVAGEIYIGGAGIARGYLNRPELTAERFVPDRFTAARSGRLYRTGDLGRWRADGTIEYLGRNDQQVKIRGFRVELGEIEAQLLRHGQVNEAAVVARNHGSGETSLIAYLVPATLSAPPAASELHAHVKSALPDYMVPGAFVILERLPLTSNGKLDRNALPAPQTDTWAGQRYEAPQGQREQTLTELWQELLRLDRVGRHDNFFQLGGHSLQAVKLIARIEQRFGVRLPVSALFQYPTIQKLSEALELALWREAQELQIGWTKPADQDMEEGVIGDQSARSPAHLPAINTNAR